MSARAPARSIYHFIARLQVSTLDSLNPHLHIQPQHDHTAECPGYGRHGARGERHTAEEVHMVQVGGQGCERCLRHARGRGRTQLQSRSSNRLWLYPSSKWGRWPAGLLPGATAGRTAPAPGR